MCQRPEDKIEKVKNILQFANITVWKADFTRREGFILILAI